MYPPVITADQLLHRVRAIVLLLLILLVLNAEATRSVQAEGINASWLNATSGNWIDNANWNSANPPNNGTDTCEVIDGFSTFNFQGTFTASGLDSIDNAAGYSLWQDALTTTSSRSLQATAAPKPMAVVLLVVFACLCWIRINRLQEPARVGVLLVLTLIGLTTVSKTSLATIIVDPDTVGAVDVIQDPWGAATPLTNPIADPLNLGAEELAVGNTSAGMLAIEGGGAVSSGAGYIGYDYGSMGVVTVDGAGSTWTNSYDLYVGIGSSGVLNITNGGAVSNSYSNIALNAGSTGVVTVDGAGSTWTNSDRLLVGNFGSGTMNITGGGAVSNDYSDIGYNSGSTGVVTVDGAGSTWTNSNGLFVGIGGSGTMNITNGGTISNSYSNIGVNAGSMGMVTVDGAGSTWTSSNDLIVGIGGSGTLNITNGGTISNSYSNIGVNAGSMGMVTVDGAGSTWTNSYDLYVGIGSSGVLNITNGGAVSNSYSNIALNAGSTGVVTVDGAGSTWTNSNGLFVGIGGSGVLNITGGGAVSNSYSFIGYNSGSTGIVNMDGAGSTWTNSDSLLVGNFGSGTMNITGGGAVSNSYSNIGYHSGSTGEVTVDGESSTWTIEDQVRIGASGTGTLTIRNGGAVSNLNQGFIGVSLGSQGSVTVDGGDSTWTNGQSLTVGDQGTGTLTIRNRGTVSAGGTVNVNTPQSRITLDGGTLTAPSVQLSGTLDGIGFIDGNLDNMGTVAPGFSPGFIDIDGDYAQQADGTLEIEIGGLTPGTQHDQLRVTGSATLAGRLEILIINVPDQPPYSPQVGDSITFLTTASHTGQFDAVVAPNLADFDADVAIAVNYNDPVSVTLSFEDIDTENIFVSQVSEIDGGSEWITGSNWSNVVPDSTNLTVINSQIDENQRVTVSAITEDVQVHELRLVGDTADQMITVNVTDGITLAATTSVTVDSYSQLELGADDGTTGEVAAHTIDVAANAIIFGNGALRGDVTLNDGATLSPGFSVGHTDVDGDYEQVTGSRLIIEIEGDAAGQFDTVVISGQAELGGTLEIDASAASILVPGTKIEFLTADGITGEFDNIEVTDPDDMYSEVTYSPVSVSVSSFDKGDLNRSGGPDQQDIELFALGLISPLAYRNEYPEHDFPDYTADMNGENGQDFDDIPDFVAWMSGASVADVYAAMNEIRNHLAVPEPTTSGLAVLAAGIFVTLGRNRSCRITLEYASLSIRRVG